MSRLCSTCLSVCLSLPQGIFNSNLGIDVADERLGRPIGPRLTPGASVCPGIPGSSGFYVTGLHSLYLSDGSRWYRRKSTSTFRLRLPNAQAKACTLYTCTQQIGPSYCPSSLPSTSVPSERQTLFDDRKQTIKASSAHPGHRRVPLLINCLEQTNNGC